MLHVGTNNLERGVWEKDEKDFVQLIPFNKTKISDTSKVPRWDSGASHEQSFYYINRKLTELSPLYNLTILNSNNTFILSDTFYACDGLNVNVKVSL